MTKKKKLSTCKMWVTLEKGAIFHKNCPHVDKTIHMLKALKIKDFYHIMCKKKSKKVD